MEPKTHQNKRPCTAQAIYITAFFCLFLVSCASNARFDTDRNSPSYYRGGNRFFIPHLGSSLKSIIDRGPEYGGNNRGQSSVGVKQKSVAEEDAALGVLASGLMLFINKDYYQSSYLSGNCICQTITNGPAQGLDLPCSNIVVVLYDSQGKELSRILSEDGEFVFPVEKEKNYRLGILSSKYEVIRREVPALKMGDNVVLRLTPKRSVSAE